MVAVVGWGQDAMWSVLQGSGLIPIPNAMCPRKYSSVVNRSISACNLCYLHTSWTLLCNIHSSLHLVFKGPVHQTRKKPKLNWTELQSSLFCGCGCLSLCTWLVVVSQIAYLFQTNKSQLEPVVTDL